MRIAYRSSRGSLVEREKKILWGFALTLTFFSKREKPEGLVQAHIAESQLPEFMIQYF